MEILSNHINSYRPIVSNTNDQESVRKVEDVESTESRTDPTQRQEGVNAADKPTESVGASEQNISEGQDAGANQDKKNHDTETETANKQSPEQPLSEEERKEVEQLKKRDAEVRAHEAAHLAAAGPYANSGAKLDYKRGPDGGLYAISGEVEIDTTKPKDPEEALRKAEQVRAAALAPARPSAQDGAVAAQAAQAAAEARAEISQDRNDDDAEGVQSAPDTDNNVTEHRSASSSAPNTDEDSDEFHAENEDRARVAAQKYQELSRIPRETTGVELDVVA